MTHLTQPNQRLTFDLDFTANDGRSWTVPYTFELEPVMSANGRKGWRSVRQDPDSEALFGLWCSRQRSKFVGLYEAIGVFKDELYGLCIDQIASDGADKAHWTGLLSKLRNEGELDVQRAKSFPIEDIMRRYGLEVNRAGFIQSPFMPDQRTGSLKIYPNTNTWYDFASSQGSSTIDFVMKMSKCGFVEAVNFLR